MEEKPKLIIDDDDIEILDFNDDIIEESPEIEEIIIKDVVSKPESIEINEESINVEPIQEEVVSTVINPVEDKINTQIEQNINVQNNIEQVSNTNLLNQALSINDEAEQSIDIDEKVDTNQNSVVNEEKQEQVFIDNKVTEEKSKPKKNKDKTNSKWKSILLGVLIFVSLFVAIIALPFISNHVNKKASSQNINQTGGNANSTTEEFKSNIDVKKALQSIKDYKNYQYQNINTISTKDNTEQLMSIKNNYIYSFNETRFEVYINKTVADFSYEIKDYYEKLDDIYNLYINDVTTKTYTKKNTIVEDFDKLTNMFPNMINYLINNYNVSEEKLLKVGNEKHIDITLKVPKDIVNNMSVETDRIQNKIDSTKLEQDFVYVDLLFDKNEKLYRIEIEIEDKNASQELLENSVESAILKYIFTDFNKTVDITLPTL